MKIRITRHSQSGDVSTSTLYLPKPETRVGIEVIGTLPHNSTWAPASDLDAAVLRDWLEANYNIEREPAEPSRKPRPKAGQPKLPPRPLRLYWANGIPAPHRYWVRVLNFREPRNGEFYLSGAIPEIYQAPRNLGGKYWVVEILEIPEPKAQNFHEYA